MVGTERRKDREQKVGSRKAEVVKERWREKRRKPLLLREGLLTLFPVMFLRNLVPWMFWEVCGDSCGFAECVPAVSSGVLVVTDVSGSPSSVGVLGEAFLSCSDGETVEPQSFLSRKRQAFCVESQEDMKDVGTTVKSTAGILKED